MPFWGVVFQEDKRVLKVRCAQREQCTRIKECIPNAEVRTTYAMECFLDLVNLLQVYPLDRRQFPRTVMQSCPYENFGHLVWSAGETIDFEQVMLTAI